MPKSEKPRKKKPAGSPVLQRVIEQARALDRRRVAQITNQVASINRLLKNGEYGQEMKILHEGAAQLVTENEALTAALKALADACALTLPGGAISDEIDAAMQEATRLVGPMTDPPPVRSELIPGTPYFGPPLSGPVSESGASAG